ncbi:MAG TPA: PAS domain S-box protein [Nitrospirota bacterium]|nr:PAS domain S-box protein [Nitrospirota bacterium]
MYNNNSEKRDNTEDALRASEERFFAIFNSVNDAIFIHNAATCAILDVNDKMCEMFGYTREEALTVDVGDLSSGISPYMQEDAVTKVKRAASGEPQLFEWHYKHKNGQLFWGEVNMKRASIGGANHVLVTVHDITERKLAAEKLQESEQRYRVLFESANDAILLMGKVYIVDCNPKSLEMFGCTREQIIGRTLYRFFPPSQPDLSDSDEKILAKIKAALLEYPQMFEWVLIKSDGTPFTAEVSLNKVELVTGTFIQAIVRDITERKRIEEALMREKVFSDAVIDSLPGVLYICDEDGKLLRWNNNEKETTGYSMAELTEMNVLKLFHQDRHLVETKIREVLESGHTYLEASIITKSGMPIPFYLTGCRMVMDGKRYIVGIGIDISERKKLESQLRQAQKLEAIGALAGGIAHDFNNILSAIMGYAYILQMKMKPDDELRHHVEHVLASAERAAGLTGALLAFTRKQPIELKPVNVNEMICGFQKMLARLIGEDIDFIVNVAADDLIVESDKVQLEQVLMNLVMNARDAMPRGGKLIVTTDKMVITDNQGEIPSGSYALITVTDTGSGMDKTIQEHIFEPFFTTKEVGKGTGLGLALVYGTIKNHNGFIHVYSEPGMGTTFKMYLPILSHGKQENILKENAPLLHGMETVLLVEDDANMRRVTKDVLKEFGYTVLEAIDGEDAVRVFHENRERVRIVLCDLIMPKMNGQETFEELIKIRPDIKTIFMSGYTAEIISQKGILEKGMNFISKPMSLTDLLNKMRTVLDS